MLQVCLTSTNQDPCEQPAHNMLPTGDILIISIPVGMSIDVEETQLHVHGTYSAYSMYSFISAGNHLCLGC